jgi:DNA-binding NtrC family response regulator
MNILIIEDNELQKKVLIKFIKIIEIYPKSINIFIKKNGKEALDFIQYTQEKIDLIFTNLTMPIIDGMAFYNKFREINNSIPMVKMTCNQEEMEKIASCDAISHFMKKPIEFSDIKNIIYKYYNIDEIDHSMNKMVYT